MKIPTLSILTPTYNRGHLLENLCRSIKPHSFIREWLIVDDGSTDGTEDMVKKLSDEMRHQFTILYIKSDLN